MFNLSNTENQIFFELSQKDTQNKSSGKTAFTYSVDLIDGAAADDTFDGDEKDIFGYSKRQHIKFLFDL